MEPQGAQGDSRSPKMTPKGPQDDQGGTQDGPQKVPSYPKMGSQRLQGAPRLLAISAVRALDGPTSPQQPANSNQDGSDQRESNPYTLGCKA